MVFHRFVVAYLLPPMVSATRKPNRNPVCLVVVAEDVCGAWVSTIAYNLCSQNLGTHPEDSIF
jgi:hypothetical protein